MPSVASGARCDLGRSDGFRFHIADVPVAPGVAPRPAERIVEHCECLSSLKLANDFGVIGRFKAKLGAR